MAALYPTYRKSLLDGLDDAQLLALETTWRRWWARPKQLAPPGNWTIWVIRAGRGFGKTRSASEWVREKVMAGEARRIALVSDTAADTRDVMIRGPAGLCSIGPPSERPVYRASDRTVTWPNGAVAIAYSAEAPELLRGPEHDLAWCDELAKWRNLRKVDVEGGTAWDNLLFGLRIGEHPQVCISTTPRNVPTVRRILQDPSAVVVQASTYENLQNLSPLYRQTIQRFEGTRLGRQELEGDILDDNPGALWNHAGLDLLRVCTHPALVRIGLAIDPAVSAEETSADTGIIVAGLGVDGHGYVLDDLTVHDLPAAWARAALNGYARWRSGTIVAEVNNGGNLVEHTLRTTCGPKEYFRYEAVHAAQGKIARAEPISALYQRGMVHHVGSFPELEDQMCTWTPGQKSPDRLDALVWVLTWLFPNEGPAGSFKDVKELQESLPRSMVDRSTLRAFS